MFDYDAAPHDAICLCQIEPPDATPDPTPDATTNELTVPQRAHGRRFPDSKRDRVQMGKSLPEDIASQLRQLEAVFGALSDSVLIVDRHGRILRANAADRATFAYDTQANGFTTTLRQRAKLLMARDELGQPIPEEQSPFARILRGETLSGQHAVEATVRTAAGSELQVSISGTPLVDAAGTLIGGVIVTRDITEERRRERGLQDANRDLQDLLAIAAHDMRTPIAASKGYVQLAITRLNNMAATMTKKPELVGAVERLRKNLQEAEHSTQRLTRLVERLLDVARLQADRLQMELEVVDLAEIIRTIMREQRLAEPTRVIRFVAHPLQPVLVVADADRIAQVLLNYLANALKFSSEESAVEVTLDVRDGDARVSVRDKGMGIPTEDQERIWSRFEQLEERRRSTSAAGLGLGLYISRAIVEALGGRVGVAGAVGGGSIFWFELPLARSIE